MDSNNEMLDTFKVKIKKSDNRNLNHFLSWVLIICSIISSLIKNDCNIFLGFILVICLNRHYFQNKSYYVKIMFQFFSLSLIFDIIFMIILFPFWINHKNENNIYLNSFKNLHYFGIIMGIVEFLLKILISYLLLNDYKSVQESIKGLFSFKYPEREELK